MNTAKQINVMVALVFIAVLTAGAYTMWDPGRAHDAKAEQLNKTVDRGAYLFSQNCRTCHGDSGEGGLKANRLKAALALNRPDLQGRTAADGPVDLVKRTEAFKRVYYTITCGRIGTNMPTWGQSQGGTLNDQQIQQLAAFITEGTGWQDAANYAKYGVPSAHIHGDASDNITLTEPLDSTATVVFLSDVNVLAKGGHLQIGDEIMVITDVNKELSRVDVTRPFGSTKAAAHDVGAQVLTPPVAPDPAAITGKDTPPSCGQNPPAVAASPTPGGAPAASPTAAAPVATLTLVAQNILFDQTSLAMTAGQPLTITFDNKDSGIPHNLHVYKGKDASGESVASTEIAAGPKTETLNFGPLTAGDYYFQCDVHPTTMFGALTVQ